MGPIAPTDRTVHLLDGQGTVRDWLVSPAWTAPCDDLEALVQPTGSPWGRQGRWVLTNGPEVAPLKERLYAGRPLRTDQPLPSVVENGRLSWFSPTGARDTGTWRRYHTGEDGFVDWSAFHHTPAYRHAVAATLLEVDQPEWRVLRLASTGPVAIWVGGELLGVFVDVAYMDPIEHRVRVRLPSGTTTIFVATWQVAFRECRHVVRLRVEGLPVRVVVPSPGADEYAAALAEQALERVAVPAWAVRDGVVRLVGPPGLSVRVQGEGTAGAVRLRFDDEGRASIAVAELVDEAAGGDADDTERVRASMLEAGDIGLVVRVDDDRCPPARRFRVAVLPEGRYGTAPGDPETWRTELLRHVADGPPSAARALARWALDPGLSVSESDLLPGMEMLRERADCADFQALALLHVWQRIPADRLAAGGREAIRRAFLEFKYWIDQPGVDAMCYFTENHQISWHVAEFLAGQTFPNERFSNTGWTGARHADHGKAAAIEWMRRKLAGGFSEFDSNAYVAIDCLALVSLVEFSADERVARLAEALLDKLLFSLAANSWRGIYAAAHGRSYTQMLRSARFEETGPITWLLWGMGALNSATLPATALATAARYVLPPVIRAVAHDRRDVWEGRQVYRGRYRFEADLLARPYGSDLRIWRTPHGMLSSVQDYRHGLPGLQELTWKATLGPELQIFATHPANAADHSSARPNAWAGHRILPRVRQHRDSLIALHAIPADDPVGTTHAWFPVEHADEWTTFGSWLVARIGDGYAALAADGGLVPVTTGNEAYQAWRPRNGGRAYVATLGNRISDGDFADFVRALGEPTFGTPGASPSVRWTARDGRVIVLDWDGLFLVDGRSLDLGPDGRPETPLHIENPACRHAFADPTLVVAMGSERLVLDLVRGERVEPASGVPSGR